MWLAALIVLLVAAAAGGSIFLGGIFTIILIPLAVIGIVVALGYSLIAGSARASEASEHSSSRRSPPTRTSQTGTPEAPATPGQLADVRRANQ